MTIQTNDGIDQLLAAEKNAAEKVGAAKLRKYIYRLVIETIMIMTFDPKVKRKN
jgi:hypothetical protein